MGTPPSITVAAGATTGNTSTIMPTPPPGTPPGTTLYSFINCITNAPAASCSISTNDPLNHNVFNLTQDTTVTVTFNSTAPASLVRRLDPRQWNRWVRVAIPGLICFTLLLPLARRTRVARGFRYGVALGSVMLMVTIIASCDSAGTGGGQRPPPSPTGSFTIKVNAFTESNTTGTPDATATIGVTVT